MVYGCFFSVLSLKLLAPDFDTHMGLEFGIDLKTWSTWTDPFVRAVCKAKLRDPPLAVAGEVGVSFGATQNSLTF